MSGARVTLTSRAGRPKPISKAQALGLRAVAAGNVFERRGHALPQLLGIRSDVYEVLARNDLLEVLDDAENPESRWTRHRVVLTARGRDALESLDAS